MCDDPQLKEGSFLLATQENSIKDQDKSIMEFEFIETNSPDKCSVELGLVEELDAKSTGSPSPSSDLKICINKSLTKTVLSNSLRTTRSKDNPDFVAKQKSFMAKVQAASSGNCEPLSPSERPDTPGKRKRENNSIIQIGKRKKISRNDNGSQEWQNDNCCWVCHREGQFICCEMCPRVFHLKCANLEEEPEEDWACSECHAVMQAENVENRSKAMQLISVDQLCVLLKYALNRLKSMPVMEPFSKPVDIHEFPTYWDIVVHPVDFTSLERNIKKKFYGSTEAFLSDARWIVHNSVIFNGDVDYTIFSSPSIIKNCLPTANSKVTSLARTLIKILKQELSEIETCPDCYENAHKKPDRWFSEACRLAHPLVWARLKGFPFWPAKAVKWKDSNVDVRFFGRHDRSWVPLKECFLFSEQMPTPLKNRNKTLESCLIEVEEHVKKLKDRFGKFRYAPHRLPFNPYDTEQIKLLLPLYKGPIMRVRSQSFSSRQSGHSGTDDETSSIASTDSGNSSYTRWKKQSLKDACTLNTPETETETDHSSVEDESAKVGLSEGTREERDKLSNEGEIKEEEGEERKSLAIHENEPPDKEKTMEEKDDETTEEQETSLKKWEAQESDRIMNGGKDEEERMAVTATDLNGELDSDNNHVDLESDTVMSEGEESSLTSVTKNENVPDIDPNVTKCELELEGELTSTIWTKSLGCVEEMESQSQDLKIGVMQSDFERNHQTNLKPNSISMKVIKITQLKVKEPKSGNEYDEKISSIILKPKVEETEEEKTISSTNNSDPQLETELKDEEESVVLPELKEISNQDVKDKEESLKASETGDEEVSSTKCFASKENSSEDEKSEVSSQIDLNSADSMDENIRNLEKINELLRREELKEKALIKGDLDMVSPDSQREYLSSNTSVEMQSKSNKSFNNKLVKDVLDKENSSQVSQSDAKDHSMKLTDKSKEDEKQKNPLEPPKRNSIDEMMDDDYFQGFLDEINLRKKVENYQKIMKNAQVRSPGEADMTSENNTDEEDKEKESPKMDLSANSFSEQLMTNSSLTIGKVSLPKSIKVQKMSGSRHSSYDEDPISTKSLPSVNIKSIMVAGKQSAEDKDDESEEEALIGEDKDPKEEDLLVKESSPSLIDFQNYANKMFHNITISSKSLSSDKDPLGNAAKEKDPPKPKTQVSSSSTSVDEMRKTPNHANNTEERERRSSTKEELEERAGADEPSNASKETSDSESLMEAVRLVKKIGNIAIKRVDSQTLEHSSGNDKVTISVASASTSSTSSAKSDTSKDSMTNKPTTSPSSVKKPERKSSDNPLMGIGTSVSVTKASDKDRDKEKDKDKDRDKDKVKMPSGVDTTRLSPSISIIPVASSSSSSTNPVDKARVHASPLSGVVSTSTPQSSATTTPTTTMTTVFSSSASPGFSMGATPPSSSISASPSIPPPPLLSHSLPSPTGAPVRGGIIPPPVPGMSLAGGPRTPITSPGLRMMAQPGMMLGNRHPGAPLGRHLPPEAGPLSAELNKHAHKLAEMMRASLEEVLGGLVGVGTPEARLAALQLELERSNWRHQQELIEVRHNADVMLVEMRANLEAERQRAVDEARRQMEQKLVEIRRQMEAQMSEMRRQAEVEKQRAIEETKKKQWCAHCGKEALFFCCWNTSYCDYPCQQAHWPQHMSVCGQNSDSAGVGGQTNPESVGESINGDASTHSSRGTTPVQGHLGGQVKNLIDDDEPFVEETKIRKKKFNDCIPPGLVRSTKNHSSKKVRHKKKRRSKSKTEEEKISDRSDEDVDDGSQRREISTPDPPFTQNLLLKWFMAQRAAKPLYVGEDDDDEEGEDDQAPSVEGVLEHWVGQKRKKATTPVKWGDADKPAVNKAFLLSGGSTGASKKKRKSTPCVRKRGDLILSPEQVTSEMLDRVATKPREKIHDQESGTSCHQCRQKTSDTKTICRSGRCVGLRGFFCGPCLKTRYGEDACKALLDPVWACPVCRGVCNCSLCRKTFRPVPSPGGTFNDGGDLKGEGSGLVPQDDYLADPNATDKGEEADSEES